jgi:DNA-binding transcriptional MerR regulator
MKEGCVMAMKVKEVAELVGISIRTLHHYDEINLLNPQQLTSSGYRLYSTEDLERLQQILFFRELGFSLKEIKKIIDNPAFDRREALHVQRNMLVEKRKRIDRMIATIDKTIQHMKGEIQMTDQEKFEGFDFSRNPYEQEARERWGNEAVDRSQAKLDRLGKERQRALGEKMNAIYRELAALRDKEPGSEQAQTAIREWYNLLQEMTGQWYSPEAFKNLGQMYVDDERFTKNIDQFGNGLSRFMRDAMAIFAERVLMDNRKG